MTVSGRLGRVRPEGGNAVWLTIERAVQMTVSFAVGALVARHLGVADYGVLAYAIALTVLLVPFWSTCQALVVRDLTTAAVTEGVILGSAAALHAAATSAAVLMLGAAIVFVPSLAPRGAVLPVVVLLAGALCRPAMVVDYWFQSRLAARTAVLARMTSLLVITALRVAAVLAAASLLIFASIAALESLVTSTALLTAYRRQGNRLSRFAMSSSYIRTLSREALPLLGAGIAVVLYMRIDQAMLGAIATARETGLYAIAVNVSEVLFFFPMLLNTVLLPGMTRTWERGSDVYYARLQGLFSAAVAGTVMLALAAAVAGRLLIPLLYGKDFAPAVPVFLLLLLGLPFVAMGTVQSIWSAHARRQGLALIRTGIAAVINIGLNLVLLPKYGAQGAAITTVVAYATAGFLANAFLRQSWPIFRLQLSAFRLRGLRAILTDLKRREAHAT